MNKSDLIQEVARVAGLSRAVSETVVSAVFEKIIEALVKGERVEVRGQRRIGSLPVVADGRLFWIQDAYTHTDRYPYSARLSGLNYIRNSVKVVVNAHDGSVTFYLVDQDDPIARAYDAIYPDLFTPFEEMPLGLRAHVGKRRFHFRKLAAASKEGFGVAVRACEAACPLEVLRERCECAEILLKELVRLGSG
jgi:hypothetical protein